MVNVTNEYTEDALRRTEDAIQMALDEIRESRARFRRCPRAASGPAGEAGGPEQRKRQKPAVNFVRLNENLMQLCDNFRRKTTY